MFFFSHKTLLESFSGCKGPYYWGCCTSSKPCGAAEGHCGYDEDCLGHLLCDDNCYFHSTLNGGNCCYDPFPGTQRFLLRDHPNMTSLPFSHFFDPHPSPCHTSYALISPQITIFCTPSLPSFIYKRPHLFGHYVHIFHFH